MTNNSNLLNAKSVASIIAKRRIITGNDIGNTMRFNVEGNGSLVVAKKKDGSTALSYDGVSPLMKTIYNLKLNSHVAMTSALCRGILAEGWAAEQAGDALLADEKYRQYLNKTQVSFTVLAGRKNVQFYNGQLVEGEVKMITTENGSLLTIEGVNAVAVQKAAETKAFTFMDLLGTPPELAVEDVFSGTNGIVADGPDAILAAAGTQADA